MAHPASRPNREPPGSSKGGQFKTTQRVADSPRRRQGLCFNRPGARPLLPPSRYRRSREGPHGLQEVKQHPTGYWFSARQEPEDVGCYVGMAWAAAMNYARSEPSLGPAHGTELDELLGVESMLIDGGVGKDYRQEVDGAHQEACLARAVLMFESPGASAPGESMRQSDHAAIRRAAARHLHGPVSGDSPDAGQIAEDIMRAGPFAPTPEEMAARHPAGQMADRRTVEEDAGTAIRESLDRAERVACEIANLYGGGPYDAEVTELGMSIKSMSSGLSSRAAWPACAVLNREMSGASRLQGPGDYRRRVAAGLARRGLLIEN